MATKTKKPALNELRRRNSVPGRTEARSPFPDLDAAVGSLTKPVPLDQIEPMPGQPRVDFDDDSLAELAASIAERGVLQPIRVKSVALNRYQLVAGERRWRAAARAGLEVIPAFICAPGDPTDEFADALVENILRQDLSDIEIARGLETLMSDWGVDQSEAARRLGFSKTKASRLLATLRLPAEIQSNLRSGLLTLSHVEPLLPPGLTDEQRVALAREALREGLSARQFAHRVGVERAESERRAAEAAGVGETPKRRPRPAARVSAERLAYAQRWSDAAARATGIEVAVTAARGDAYHIKVASHEALAALGEKLGLAPIDL